MIHQNNKISVLGCGWYGLALAKELVALGYTVKGSTTSTEKLSILQASGISAYLANFQEKKEEFKQEFFDSGILIISIPPKKSLAEQHTFLTKIERISKAAKKQANLQVIFISSTSVYGDHNEEVDESTVPLPDTDSGKAMLDAENFLRGITDFTTTVIRFGGLIGVNRDPGRFFAGKKDIPNGKAPVNLIYLPDCIGITLSIIERQAYGYIYNACSIDHPSRSLFYTLAARKSKLDKPVFIDELLSWKKVKSLNVPEQLGYIFKITLNDPVSQ